MSAPSASTETESIPTGREEVTAAILESAAQLFAERGPAAASIRDIAARARINHGLITRHVGNKEQLVAAVLNHQADQLAELVDTGAPLPKVAEAGTRQLRVIARTLLDGYPVAEMQTNFPAANALLDQVRRQHDSEDTARMATANAIALMLGWQMFEPFLRAALGLQDLPAETLRNQIGVGMGTLSQPR